MDTKEPGNNGGDEDGSGIQFPWLPRWGYVGKGFPLPHRNSPGLVTGIFIQGISVLMFPPRTRPVCEVTESNRVQPSSQLVIEVRGIQLGSGPVPAIKVQPRHCNGLTSPTHLACQPRGTWTSCYSQWLCCLPCFPRARGKLSMVSDARGGSRTHKVKTGGP